MASIQEIYTDLMKDPFFTPMPGKTRHETAWETAFRKWRQQENNNMALSLAKDIDVEKSYHSGEKMKKQDTTQSTPTPEMHWCPKHSKFEKEIHVEKQVKEPFAVATAQAKRMGYSDFSEGSPGYKKRGEIAEALKSTDINTVISLITKEDIQNIAQDVVKQMTPGAQRAKQRGLVPQSGDWNNPKRWVLPEDSWKKKPKPEPDYNPERYNRILSNAISDNLDKMPSKRTKALYRRSVENNAGIVYGSLYGTHHADPIERKNYISRVTKIPMETLNSMIVGDAINFRRNLDDEQSKRI